MKKLSLLIALMLCVTVGGVYATWIYHETSISSVSQKIAHNMAGVENKGEAGSYTFDPASQLTVIIDQKENSEHEAELKYEGSAKITFTAVEGASEGEVENALNATLYLTANDVDLSVYDEKQIWDVDTAFAFELTAGDWTDEGNGVYTYVIDWENCTGLKDAVKLNAEGFQLHNTTEYNTFKEAQDRATIYIHIAPTSTMA